MGSVVGGIVNAATSIAQPLLGAVGGFGQNVSQSFTPQNQFQATPWQVPQQDFSEAIKQSQAGLNNNINNQNVLGSALLAQSQGQGPNPALAMLNNQTNQNIKQNAGMLASQKGINPALAQRLASQNAANMNQQATGQGAVLGAQQQLAAQQGLGSLYGQVGGQQLNNQQILQNSLANQNQANVQQNLGVQGLNANAAAGNAAANQHTMSGLLGGTGSAGQMGAMMAAHGGMVPGYADGGEVLNYDPNNIFAQQLSQISQQSQTQPAQSGGGVMGTIQSMMKSGSGMSKGGSVAGKAKVKGDSLKNDKVPAMLSPGEIVVPRSKADDVEKATAFVAQLIKKKKGKEAGGSSYSKVLEAHRKLGEQLKGLESKGA